MWIRRLTVYTAVASPRRRAQNRLRAGWIRIARGAKTQGQGVDDAKLDVPRPSQDVVRAADAAHMVRDSKMCAKLDVERRQRLLQNASAARPACFGAAIRSSSTAPASAGQKPACASDVDDTGAERTPL